MDAYALIKFIHVLLSIVAVGFNMSYGIWLARANKEPTHTEYVVRGVKFLDDRFANPAYILLFVTGLAMVFVGNLPLTRFWIAASLVLWLVGILFAFLVYTPILRGQIEALVKEGTGSATFKSLYRRGTLLGIFLAVLILAIIFLMVVKPNI